MSELRKCENKARHCILCTSKISWSSSFNRLQIFLQWGYTQIQHNTQHSAQDTHYPHFLGFSIYLLYVWMLIACPSPTFAESAGLPSPPCGSVASSKGSAVADGPTRDPSGKPTHRGTGWLTYNWQLDLMEGYFQLSELYFVVTSYD